MRKPVLVFAVLLAACGLSAAGDVEDRLRSDAEWMCQAVVKGDPDAILDHTYPGLLEKIGGRNILRESLVESQTDMRQRGLHVIANEIVSISDPLQAGAEMHAVVQIRRTIKGPTGRQIHNTFVIAVSVDKGENWTFMDGSGLTPKHIEAMFPDFNDALILPEKTEPVFERDPS